MTLSGLSRFNVENALAATGAGLAAGLPRTAVIEGLRSFQPEPRDNPGRMNVYDLHAVTVVVDLAHNEAGLGRCWRCSRPAPPGNAVRLVLGGVGDRTDELIRGIGEIGARGADEVVIGHKEKYLRGRERDELAGLLREGAASVGVHDVPEHATELAATEALLGRSRPGDVVGVMCHAERTEAGCVAAIRRRDGRRAGRDPRQGAQVRGEPVTGSPVRTLTGDGDADLPEFDEPPAEPFGLLRAWLADADERALESRAFTLATCDDRGHPSSRTLLLHEITDQGLVFCTYGQSRKGRELRANPWASATFYWRETLRQVNVGGRVLLAARGRCRPVVRRPHRGSAGSDRHLRAERTARRRA